MEKRVILSLFTFFLFFDASLHAFVGGNTVIETPRAKLYRLGEVKAGIFSNVNTAANDNLSYRPFSYFEFNITDRLMLTTKFDRDFNISYDLHTNFLNIRHSIPYEWYIGAGIKNLRFNHKLISEKQPLYDIYVNQTISINMRNNIPT